MNLVEPPRKVRVLVVDDSALVRKLVSDALNAEPDMEVIGTASNGKLALERIEFAKPDVVLLDLEMPEMDGITTLKRLRKQDRKLPVVVFSTLTERGAKSTLDALAAGATDYLCKPSGTGSLANSRELLHGVLAPKLRGFALRDAQRNAEAQTPAPAPRAMRAMAAAPQPQIAERAASNSESIDALVVGCSAGGPQALAEFVPKLPRTLGVPVLIVQHMPPLFTKFLAERLSVGASLKVVEATDGASIEPGFVYIARGGEHMKVGLRSGHPTLTLDEGPQENGCRPAVDPLFRSASAVYRRGLLALVMTGMGTDGTLGAQEVVRAGGRVWAQDENSSTIWGMAGSVVRAGLAERVCKLNTLAEDVARAIARSRPNKGGGVRART